MLQSCMAEGKEDASQTLPPCQPCINTSCLTGYNTAHIILWSLWILCWHWLAGLTLTLTRSFFLLFSLHQPKMNGEPRLLGRVASSDGRFPSQSLSFFLSEMNGCGLAESLLGLSLLFINCWVIQMKNSSCSTSPTLNQVAARVTSSPV
jgi:hypothetical protein